MSTMFNICWEMAPVPESWRTRGCWDESSRIASNFANPGGVRVASELGHRIGQVIVSRVISRMRKRDSSRGRGQVLGDRAKRASTLVIESLSG